MIPIIVLPLLLCNCFVRLKRSISPVNGRINSLPHCLQRGTATSLIVLCFSRSLGALLPGNPPGWAGRSRPQGRRCRDTGAASACTTNSCRELALPQCNLQNRSKEGNPGCLAVPRGVFRIALPAGAAAKACAGCNARQGSEDAKVPLEFWVLPRTSQPGMGHSETELRISCDTCEM